MDFLKWICLSSTISEVCNQYNGKYPECGTRGCSRLGYYYFLNKLYMNAQEPYAAFWNGQPGSQISIAGSELINSLTKEEKRILQKTKYKAPPAKGNNSHFRRTQLCWEQLQLTLPLLKPETHGFGHDHDKEDYDERHVSFNLSSD